MGDSGSPLWWGHLNQSWEKWQQCWELQNEWEVIGASGRADGKKCEELVMGSCSWKARQAAQQEGQRGLSWATEALATGVG